MQLIGPGQAGWKFSGDESFPGGYVMTARSLEIDLAGLTRRLGQLRRMLGFEK